MAEIELNGLNGQCLNRRIDNIDSVLIFNGATHSSKHTTLYENRKTPIDRGTRKTHAVKSYPFYLYVAMYQKNSLMNVKVTYTNKYKNIIRDSIVNRAPNKHNYTGKERKFSYINLKRKLYYHYYSKNISVPETLIDKIKSYNKIQKKENYQRNRLLKNFYGYRSGKSCTNRKTI